MENKEHVDIIEEKDSVDMLEVKDHVEIIKYYLNKIRYVNLNIKSSSTPLADYKRGQFNSGGYESYYNKCMEEIEKYSTRIEKECEQITKKYDGTYKQKIIEITKTINVLSKDCGKAVNNSKDEIDNLIQEMLRIVDGKQEEYEKIEAQIEELKTLRNACLAINFIKKHKLTNQINECETQKMRLM